MHHAPSFFPEGHRSSMADRSARSLELGHQIAICSGPKVGEDLLAQNDNCWFVRLPALTTSR
eukprot:453360-Pelagomonas_calceolata.AAC.1